MDTPSILSFFLFYFLPCFCIYLLTRPFSRRKGTLFQLPPGPPRLPIIGNLHQIGQNHHQSLAKLAKTYGPVMSLRIGSKRIVIVSSAAAAREVLLKNDLVCSTRAIINAAYALDHHKSSMLWLPCSAKWRSIRKVSREQMLGTIRLDASHGVREEKMKALRDYLLSCSSSGKTVDIGEAVFTTILNILSTSLFSADFANYDPESSQEFRDILMGVMKCLGTANISDYFPVLQQFDPKGIRRSARFYFGELFRIFDGIIEERLLARQASETGTSEAKKNDFLEALLDQTLKNELVEFSITDVKHLIMDLFVAGAETSTSTVEWAMAELLHSPEKMEQAQAELKQVIGEKGVVQESDISRLPYLQAVVKETFRLHPAAPLLAPHKATEDIEINGHTVLKDTQIFVNVWAIARDEETWEKPEMFMPERFSGSEIDVRGQHFELIPFSAGRRICPGLGMGYRMVHLTLASLIHNISWKLEGDIEPEDLDMEETPAGLTVPKAQPLRAIPVKL